MLCFYLCTLVKRVAWVNSKFALKLQAAPVCPGSVGLQQHKKYQHYDALEESNIFQKLSRRTINKDQEKQGYTLIILKVLLAKIPFYPFQYCKITENQVHHCSKIVRVLGITLVEATR